jgi:hypothetical protein
MLLRLPASNKSAPFDFRTPLSEALVDLGEAPGGPTASEQLGRAKVAQVQLLVDASRTDRYSGLLRSRNSMLTTCSLTSLALYAMYWLGIVMLRDTGHAHTILGAALFFTTVGALVGLFQLLYIESQADRGVDDYGLSMARLIVAPQIAGLAALVGVVLTSLTTATLSGSAATIGVAPASAIPVALQQISQPANVLVAVGFALSPGLVLSRFRQRIEATKRELSKSGAAATPQANYDV